jgi:hypothetical protein
VNLSLSNYRVPTRRDFLLGSLAVRPTHYKRRLCNQTTATTATTATLHIILTTPKVPEMYTSLTSKVPIRARARTLGAQSTQSIHSRIANRAPWIDPPLYRI